MLDTLVNFMNVTVNFWIWSYEGLTIVTLSFTPNKEYWDIIIFCENKHKPSVTHKNNYICELSLAIVQ